MQFGNAGARVGELVAQVSNLLYRSASSLRMPRLNRHHCDGERSADWKSAIQQVGNLRYGCIFSHEFQK